MNPSAKSGLKRLNEVALIPGDIILMTTTAAISKTIRIATQSDISHAMVYVEIHAASPRVGNVHNQDAALLDPQ